MRWIGEHRSEENAELMVDYGATQYWKVGGRALHRDLKRHAEVTFTAMQRLKAVLKERGVREELIEAAAEPVDANKLEFYQRMME
jgi:prenyltransferase beta subunit